MSTKPLVLLTGASGFIALHVLKSLLDEGYTIRGTVRSSKKANEVKQVFAAACDSNQLTLVEVADLLRGDLEEVMRGVGVVVHTASPYFLTFEDPVKDMLEPAIEATLNVLRYAHKAGVKRVVLTSSFASVVDTSKGGPFRDYMYSDKDWNPITYEIAISPRMPKMGTYAASKKLAEEEAWKFAKETGLDRDAKSVLPPVVYGPILGRVSGASELNSSSKDILKLIDGSQSVIPPNAVPIFVDVRDVGRAHAVAVSAPNAPGKRISVYGGSFTWEEAVEHLRRVRPGLKDVLPPPPTKEERRPIATMDNTLAHEVLGIEQFIDWKKSIEDTVDDLLAKTKAWKGGKL